MNVRKASVIDRLFTLTKAMMHEGLNKLEDPLLLTGQYLRDLEHTIATAERKERELKTAVKGLERRESHYRELAEHSETEAAAALHEGQESAARVAVIAKLRYIEQAQACADERVKANLAAEELEQQIAGAREEHSRLKEKRAELAARARKASESISSAPSPSDPGLGTGIAAQGFERMEDKIAEWEALAEQAARPANWFEGDSARSTAVEAELERLKDTAQAR